MEVSQWRRHGQDGTASRGPAYQAVAEGGKQTAKRGERVSVNQVIVEILEAYFEQRTAKRGRPKGTKSGMLYQRRESRFW